MTDDNEKTIPATDALIQTTTRTTTFNRLALIDLDGIVADATERFNRARRPDGKTNWKVALNPELVTLDVPVPGAIEALHTIKDHGYELDFLTGRPEAMRMATVEWLQANGVQPAFDYYDLKMRPNGDYRAANQVKTEEINRILAEVQPSEIIFVDDNLFDYPWLIDHEHIHFYASLAECVQELARLDGWLYEDHPF